MGNEHLDPEEMTAYELGYRTTLLNRLGLNLELYYNDLNDVIELVTLRKSVPYVLAYDNAYNAISKGVEVSIDLPVAPWWTLTANYTFQEVENKRINTDIAGHSQAQVQSGIKLHL